MSTVTLDFSTEFPSRRAAEELRTQVVRFLMLERSATGTRFLTDQEMVVRSKLSRSTVRRVLDVLHQQGWIDRRIGQGTFVGPRVGTAGLSGGSDGQKPCWPVPLSTTERSVRTPGAIVRLAILIFEEQKGLDRGTRRQTE